MNPTTPEKLTAVTLAVFRLNGLLVEWGNRFSQPHGLTSARWQVMSKPWFALVKGRRDGLVGAKLRRMPWIAANGVLVLIPSALLLAHKASAGAFDGTFYAVQALELTAGAVNIVLLGLHARRPADDGAAAWVRWLHLPVAPAAIFRRWRCGFRTKCWQQHPCKFMLGDQRQPTKGATP